MWYMSTQSCSKLLWNRNLSDTWTDSKCLLMQENASDHSCEGLFVDYQSLFLYEKKWQTLIFEPAIRNLKPEVHNTLFWVWSLCCLFSFRVTITANSSFRVFYPFRWGNVFCHINATEINTKLMQWVRRKLSISPFDGTRLKAPCRRLQD